MEKEIWIVTNDTSEDSSSSGDKGWGDEVRKKFLSRKEVKLSAEELEKKMSDFLEIIDQVFEKAEQREVSQQSGKKSGIQLDEIELLVEISGKGEVKLVAGGEIAGKGALKIKFKRREF